MKATTDICDDNEDALVNGEIRVLPPIFKSYGQKNSFFGYFGGKLMIFE